MKNRPIASLLAALLLAPPTALRAEEPAKPPAKPNILFAIADDWSYGHAGAYGCKWIKTPAMDRVAREGILFTEEVRNDMLDYAFEVENFDLHLSRMLAELEKRGLLENTIVVVTSDNGMPFPHCKGYAYNNSDHLPLAIMWPKGIAKPGRVVDDYVSFIDFVPTFLEVAGVAPSASGMAAISGRSLTEIFKSDKSGCVIPQRDHVLLAKERNDVGRPNDEGYPIRGIVKGGMLYLHNFETNRWPSGLAETGYKDTDDSPTKTAVLETEKIPALKHFFDASFGKLPADQLFDLRRDPDCMTNLAATVSFAALQAQLCDELKQQGDPRMLGNGHIHDEYPYGNASMRNYYDRVMRGEKITADKVKE